MVVRGHPRSSAT